MKDSSRMRSESKSDVDPTLSKSTMDSKLTSDEEKAKARREKYSKKFKETKKVAALSEEDRFNAMLGKGKGADPTLSMDQYCGCCGVEHKAPELLDNYYLCAACQNALREPRVLREAWADRPQACKLEICYATWGHPSLPVAYFRTLKDALSKVRLYDGLTLCSLGRTTSAEMVAEVADLLLNASGVFFT